MNAKCPVCEMGVDEKDTSLQSTYAGQTYYFCCEGCQQKFEANAGKYVRAEKSA